MARVSEDVVVYRNAKMEGEEEIILNRFYLFLLFLLFFFNVFLSSESEFFFVLHKFSCFLSSY